MKPFIFILILLLSFDLEAKSSVKTKKGNERSHLLWTLKITESSTKKEHIFKIGPGIHKVNTGHGHCKITLTSQYIFKGKTHQGGIIECNNLSIPLNCEDKNLDFFIGSISDEAGTSEIELTCSLTKRKT